MYGVRERKRESTTSAHACKGVAREKGRARRLRVIDLDISRPQSNEFISQSFARS